MSTKNAQRHRAIGARLMPWFEGAVVVTFFLQCLVWLVAIVAAVGFYLVAAVTVIPVCLLVMRMGGWKVQWRELFRKGAK